MLDRSQETLIVALQIESSKSVRKIISLMIRERSLSATPVSVSWPSSGPEFRVVWLWKMPAAGWGSLWESSSFVHWLILNTFRDVSGAVPEWPWISGFMRKSSRRANAPSMRFSVLLNSCDNFLVTLPSVSSETWIMQTSCDLGIFEFCAKLLLGCSPQFSLFKAASFLLFLRVAISIGEGHFSDK